MSTYKEKRRAAIRRARKTPFTQEDADRIVARARALSKKKVKP